jgi:hypothetical protein
MPLILPHAGIRLGAGPHIVRTGLTLHRVPDENVERDALDDMRQFTETKDWFGAIAFSDGRILLRPARRDMPGIPLDVAERLVEVAKISNRELHHDGHWLWAAGDGYLTAIFRDRDGDAWFENTFADTWARLRHMDKLEWISTLEAAWQEARDRFRNIQLKPEQLENRSASGVSLLH